MPKLDILQFACLSDNYGVLIHDEETGLTASIDAPDANAILDQSSLGLAAHAFSSPSSQRPHERHLRLKEATGRIIGPGRGDTFRDHHAGEGDTIPAGN
jgi:hydroxyacylglutathione hydrolase